MSDAFSHKGLIIELDHSIPRLSIDGREVSKEKVGGLFDPSELPGVKAQKLRRFAEKIIKDSPEFKKREDAKRAQLAVLARGAEKWNRWREENPEIRPLLYDTDLSRDTFAANLRRANFSNANLITANLKGTDLEGVNFHEANLKGACLNRANLTNANFCRADLYEADLSEATLINSNLQGTQLAKTVFRGATIIGCKVYGMSAWDLDLEGAEQRDLIVRYRHKGGVEPDEDSDEDEVTVYDLRVAQFIYLLLNNENIRNALDTITWKTVLILGRFTPERKRILDALRSELREHDLVPILFDFEKLQSRNRTETISTLAHMARFVIADLTDPRSIPSELQKIIPELPSVPVQSIILESEDEYALFDDLLDHDWVLKPHKYNQIEDLLQSLSSKVIEPAVLKANEIAERRRARLIERNMKR